MSEDPNALIDKIGMLPDEALSAFIKEFEEKTKGSAKCELCGCDDWGLEPKIVSPVVLNFSENSRLSLKSSHALPSVSLSCQNCGNSKMLRVSAYSSLMKYLEASNV